MKKMSLVYPAHAFPSARAFKAEKRAHLRALRKAYEALRMGCAYFPDGDGEMGRIESAIESLERKLSAKEWGR
jgi:hypothetical protein